MSRALALSYLLVIGLRAAEAAEPTTQTVGAAFNWYYATSFGTGVYQLGDTTVTAVNMPLSYTMREPTETSWGWRLQLPVALMLGTFKLRDLGLDDLQLEAVSVMPGAELVYPLLPHWQFSAYGNVGVASELETGASAAIYRWGMSTRYRFPELGNPDLELGAKYNWAGYGSAGHYAEPISLVTLGIASSVALPWSVDESRQTRLGVQLLGTNFFTGPRFRNSGGYTELHNEWQAGLALIVRPGYRAFGATWDRIGLNYLQGSNGLHGVRLVTEFPF